MSKFVCDICKAEFKKKESLEYHIKNNVCTKNGEKNTFKCKYCGKGFPTETGMYRHMRNSCKEKKKICEKNNEIEKMKEELKKVLMVEIDKEVNVRVEKEVEKVKNEVEKKVKREVNRRIKTEVEKKTKKIQRKCDEITKELNDRKQKSPNNVTNIMNGDTNITNGNINIMNGNINNINIVAYGREDIDAITTDEMLEILQAGFNSTIKLTEKMHFNPDRPENHNICMLNKKESTLLVFNGVDWKLRDKTDIVNTLYDDKKDHIIGSMEEYKQKYPTTKMDPLKRWIDTPESHEKISEIKKGILSVICEKRDIVQETYKKHKKELSKKKILKVIKNTSS